MSTFKEIAENVKSNITKQVGNTPLTKLQAQQTINEWWPCQVRMLNFTHAQEQPVFFSTAKEIRETETEKDSKNSLAVLCIKSS